MTGKIEDESIRFCYKNILWNKGVLRKSTYPPHKVFMQYDTMAFPIFRLEIEQFIVKYFNEKNNEIILY